MLIIIALLASQITVLARENLIDRVVDSMNSRTLPGFVSARWSNTGHEGIVGVEVTVTRSNRELRCARGWPPQFDCRDLRGERGGEGLPSEVSRFVPELSLPRQTWLQIQMISLGNTPAVQLFFVDESNDDIATFVMVRHQGRWVATGRLPFMHFETSFAPMALDERAWVLVSREGNDGGAWRDARWSAVVVRVPFVGTTMSVSEPIELGHADMSPDPMKNEFRANMACPHAVPGGFEIVAPGQAPEALRTIDFSSLCERPALQCSLRAPRFEGRFAVQRGEVTRIR